MLVSHLTLMRWVIASLKKTRSRLVPFPLSLCWLWYIFNFSDKELKSGNWKIVRSNRIWWLFSSTTFYSNNILSPVSILKKILYQFVDFRSIKTGIIVFLSCWLRCSSQKIYKIWLRMESGDKIWVNVFLDHKTYRFVKPFSVLKTNKPATKWSLRWFYHFDLRRDKNCVTILPVCYHSGTFILEKSQ